MFCQKCGSHIENEFDKCPECGFQAQPNINNNVNPEDKVNTALAIVSFFFPIVGIILWAVNNKTTPVSSKTYLKVSVVSFILCVIFYIIYFGIIFAFAFS